MATYTYTILDDNYKEAGEVTGTSTRCLIDYLKDKGWTGLASGRCNDVHIELGAHQRLGYIYGRDRSDPMNKKYSKILYIRTLKHD